MKMRGKWWAAAGARAFLGLLLPAVVTALQLPPEIQADRYLLEADKEIQDQDFEGAKAAMDRILELQAQHGLELPEEFFFRYAEVVERLGLYDEAVEFVMKYLTLAGRDGEHYREAERAGRGGALPVADGGGVGVRGAGGDERGSLRRGPRRDRVVHGEQRGPPASGGAEGTERVRAARHAGER